MPILEAIKAEGEIGHYQTFRKAFLGVHPGFTGVADAWQRPVTDPLYPAYPLPLNPTAYVGHENQIQDPAARRLAWLGNLHYWSLLNLLSTGYSKGSTDLVLASRTHMMGPFMSLAKQLAKISRLARICRATIRPVYVVPLNRCSPAWNRNCGRH